MEIPADPEALDRVQSALDRFWSLHEHVPARIRTEVEIAVVEIAANIVEHCRVVSLRMDLKIFPDEVHVDFTDDGGPVDVDLENVRMPDEMAERGRGLPLAQAALRLLSYFRDEVGNHWKLVSKAFHSNATPM